MINLQRERPTCHDCHLFHLTPNYALVRYVLPNFWPLPDTTFLLHGPNVSGISKSPYKLATVFKNQLKSLILQIRERSELIRIFEFSRQKLQMRHFRNFQICALHCFLFRLIVDNNNFLNCHGVTLWF